MKKTIIKGTVYQFIYIQGRKLELKALFISLSTGKKTRIKGIVDDEK